MDLNLQEIADSIDTSEEVVKSWIRGGSIRSYTIGRQSRFDRNQFEHSLIERSVKTSEEDTIKIKSSSQMKNGTHKFSLYRAMYRGGVITGISKRDKKELFCEVMKRKAHQMGLDPELMSELLLERELLMSTGIGSGVAIPHPRDLVLNLSGSDTIITVVLDQPIDYFALDKKPVSLLFFLFSSSDKIHLHLLSKLALFAKDERILPFLLSHPDPSLFLSYIKEWELNL